MVRLWMCGVGGGGAWRGWVRAFFGKGTVTRKQINSTQASEVSVLSSRGGSHHHTHWAYSWQSQRPNRDQPPSKTLLGDRECGKVCAS